MPPIKKHSPTPAEYLLFNEMVTRIRAMEYVATQQFFNGDSKRRADIVKSVNRRVDAVQKSILGPVPTTARTLRARCPDGFCNHDGTCQWCGIVEFYQKLRSYVDQMGPQINF
jgi:hypothetical protein